jgi:glycosyltransferase involved in cell wall biosynthesis
MKKTITLCMIVKNESHIILECLNTVYKYLDYWVICDTGSTDNTKEIIKKFFEEKGIPGELHDHEWKGFGHNRTLAFDAAKGKADYALVIDADDYIEGNLPLTNIKDADAYTIKMGRVDFSWWRTQIFKLDLDWHYVGVLHEYAAPRATQNPKIEKLEGNYRVVARTLGARNQNISAIEKYSRDAELLEKALIDEPDNSRYMFYLGQSYFDSQQWQKSEDAYYRRAKAGGWPEEVYYSLLRVAMCKAMLDKPWPEIQQAFLDAYNYRPTRAEPLYHIAQIYRQKFNMPALAFLFARAAMDIPFPSSDILFVPDAIYNWGILDEVSSVAAYAGYPLIGYDAVKKLLQSGKVPKEHLERVQNNYNSYTVLIEDLKKKNILIPVETVNEKRRKKKKHK